MNTKKITVLLLFLSASFIFPGEAFSECKNDEHLICSPPNPEDLLPIPDTSLIVISSMEDEGHLYLMNTKERTSRLVFPTENSKQNHNKQLFPDCPGPLSKNFRPHGLGLRTTDQKTHTLYVVGHGEREAVEVFQLNAYSTPELTWIGCVVAPEGVSLNSIAPLPNDTFAVTNFNLNDGGELWEWQLDSGWGKIPGSEMVGPNGLVASADGKWLYVGGWQDESLIRLSRGKQPVEKLSTKVDFHIDNVRWANTAPEKTIIVAGQKGLRSDIGKCLRQGECKNASTSLAKINIETMSAEKSLNIPSTEKFILGTVAIIVGDEFWIGGIGGTRYIYRLKPNH